MQRPQCAIQGPNFCIEIVASILGAAGAGFRLSLILNAVSCEIANAPAEIHAISKSVTVFSLLLKQTAAVLDKTDSVHSKAALRTAEQVLEESNAVFAEVNAMLDRVRTKRQDGTVSPSIPQRIRWCFRKHAIEYLLGRIDRLQMSLSLMLQIMQLGKTMASTSRHDPPERVAEMSDRIHRERVEAQNVVVLYFFGNQKVDHLYLTAREESTEHDPPVGARKHDVDPDGLPLVASTDSQSTKVEELPLWAEKDLAVQPPARVLPEFEESWRRMDKSPEDMIKSSEEIINKLLDRWTVWREIRDQELTQPRSKKNGCYKTVVDDLHDDEDLLYNGKYAESEGSPAGKFLEGPTTDWRQPHSGEARQRRAQLRRAYAGYQPSVEGGSDVEDSPGSRASSKRPSHKHVIDSDEYTSESEEEKAQKQRPRRRSSAITVPSQQQPRTEEPPVSRSYAGSTTRTPAQPPNASKATPPQISPTRSQYQQHRTFAMPDQNHVHPSFSSSPHNQYIHNGAYHPPPSLPQSPSQYFPTNMPAYPFPSTPQQPSRYPPRLTPQSSRTGQPPSRPGSRDGPPRPVSRDGRPARSPSRLSKEYSAADYREYEAERKRQKKEMKRNIGDGAAKGLLAGGGLAVLLEALDAFS